AVHGGSLRRSRRVLMSVGLSRRLVRLGRDLDAAARAVHRRKAVETVEVDEAVPLAAEVPHEHRHVPELLVTLQDREPELDLAMYREKVPAFGEQTRQPGAGAEDQLVSDIFGAVRSHGRSVFGC